MKVDVPNAHMVISVDKEVSARYTKHLNILMLQTLIQNTNAADTNTKHHNILMLQTLIQNTTTY